MSLPTAKLRDARRPRTRRPVHDMLPSPTGTLLWLPAPAADMAARNSTSEFSRQAIHLTTLPELEERRPRRMYQRLPFSVARHGTPSLHGSIWLPFDTQFKNIGATVGPANIAWAQRLGLVKPASRRLETLSRSRFD